MSFARKQRPTSRNLLHAMVRSCREPLRRGVELMQADRYVKRYKSADFAMALVSHFMLGTDSLRQLKDRLDDDEHLRRHVALGGISYAQLPRLLKDRPSQLWAPLVVELLSRLNGQRAPSELRLMDTSFFTMATKLLGRIHGRPFKPEAAGMKLGMVIDPANDAPVQCDVRVGQGNDIEHVAALIPPDADIKGLTYIFDRGFLKLDFYADLIERGAAFVTRAQNRVNYRILDVDHFDPAHPEILADHKVLLGSKSTRTRLNQPVRRIEVKTENGTLTLWASDLWRPAHEIAELYRLRWQIETFFRSIKRTIGCVKPLGYSLNAAEHTLYAALVAYLICRLLADLHTSKATNRLTAKIKRALNLIRACIYSPPRRKHLQALGFA